MSLLVSVLIVIRNILIKVLKGSPAVEAVPEVVKLIDLLLGGVDVAKGRDGVVLGETGLGLEDLAPELVVVALLELLLGGRLDIGFLVDGVVLAALCGFKENLGGLLDTLEELIVLGTASGSLLIGVVLEDLLAVGLLDLVLGGLEAVLGETKNLVVILSLYRDDSLVLNKHHDGIIRILTFQSLAWSWCSMGSSASLSSLSSTSSTFLALS